MPSFQRGKSGLCCSWSASTRKGSVARRIWCHQFAISKQREDTREPFGNMATRASVALPRPRPASLTTSDKEPTPCASLLHRGELQRRIQNAWMGTPTRIVSGPWMLLMPPLTWHWRPDGVASQAAAHGNSPWCKSLSLRNRKRGRGAWPSMKF